MNIEEHQCADAFPARPFVAPCSQAPAWEYRRTAPAMRVGDATPERRDLLPRWSVGAKEEREKWSERILSAQTLDDVLH